jgi:hypothetical protein
MTSLNVHSYDGLLKESFDKLTYFDTKYLKQNFSYDEAIAEIKRCVIDINPKAYKILLQIENSKNTNFDPSNGIHFEDIFCRIWKFYRLIDIKSDEMKCFFEQIADMESGLCAQGRSGGRLYQLYNIWIFELQKYIIDADSIDKDFKNVFDKLVI